MSVTTETKTKPATKRANKTTEAAYPATAAEAAIAPPPKLRRRPLLVVASIAAVCLGGLLGVWAYTSVTTTQEVVAVRSTVPRGALISREHLVTVRIGVDPALKPIPAAQLDGVVGQRAAMDLPAGGLVTEGSLAATVIPAQDMSVVGVAVPATLLPGEPLKAGDQVRVVATPGQQGEVTDGEQRSSTATVVGVYPNAESGQTVVSVEVPYDQAAELAARAATGKVAVVLDSRER
jgi:flagella basal body P-ring formation protein FlgA